ncbi:MAG: serine/threonine protein kinase [Deltaproteobacteria bacterium]|nr:serine/threonine protein kinase [Deltaproteobacteria bacterium]
MSTPHAQPGDRIGGLVLVRCLDDAGASGAWLAKTESGERRVLRLLKTPAPSRLGNDHLRFDEDFSARLALAQRLEHPGLVRVLGGAVEAERRFAITEYVDGVDLSRLIARAERSGRWPSPTTSAAIVARLARALSYVHALRDHAGLPVVHRAISPAKILIARSGAVKLGDFSAAPLGQSSIETASYGTAIRAGYLSPELAVDPKSVDPRSDLFALGAVLWELLTHQPPFRRASDLETVAAVSAAQLPEPPEHAPAALLAIARRCLARAPSDRYPTADALADEIEAVIRGQADASAERIAALVPPDLETSLDVIAPAESAGSAKPEERREAAGAARDVPVAVGRRFEILGRIGEGGMGEVYRAQDHELGETVAIKILGASLSGDLEQLERMRREVKLARRISSPRVCRLYDLVELEDGTRGVAMELIKGRPLSHLIWEGVGVDYARFARWGADIAEGLAAAHAVGVVHRDLKPDNVMIDTEDHAIILDFGVAYTDERLELGGRLTAAGVILGTLPYMAPEQLTAAPLDGRADLYALGLILAELITGEVPFTGTRYEEVLNLRVIKPAVYHLRDRDPRVPEGLDQLVTALLASNRDQRPSHGEAVRDALRAVARGEPLPASAALAPAPAPAPPDTGPPAGPPTSTLVSSESDLPLPTRTVHAAPVFALLATIAALLIVLVVSQSMRGGREGDVAPRPRSPARIAVEVVPSRTTTVAPSAPVRDPPAAPQEPETKAKAKAKVRGRVPPAQEM